jgi:transcription antitermination factor NusG
MYLLGKKMVIENQSCHNWFVIQVKTSKEYFIKNFVEKLSDKNITMRIFARELIFKRKNKEFKCLSPLFPGYIFVYQEIDKTLDIIRQKLKTEFARPICFKEKGNKCRICFMEKSPCMVREQEMNFFLKIADESGIISLSYSLEKENNVKIVNGPLKYLNNKIIWINNKKKKACVEVELFGQKMKVNLGIDMLDFYPHEETSIGSKGEETFELQWNNSAPASRW